jgi:hypothetical protein
LSYEAELKLPDRVRWSDGPVTTSSTRSPQPALTLSVVDTSIRHRRHNIGFTAQKKRRHVFINMLAPLSLFSVNAILIMSTEDSSRIFAKYYSPPHPPAGNPPNSTDYPGANPYPSVKDQKAFEKGLLEKTVKQTSDIILYDNRVVVFKTEGDVMLYVVGGPDENEVLLYNVVVSLRDALGILLRWESLLFFPLHLNPYLAS